jgi:methionyl aminopeptidase
MIKIKTQAEIEIMAAGGKILAGIMEELKRQVRPGITTKELDRLAESLILNSGKCSFKGYGVPDDSAPNSVYPTCLCTSVNEEIVHAIPSQRILRDGDILSIDIGMEYKGFHNDMAVTVPVGKISSDIEKLLQVTKKALEMGIGKIKPGNKIGDISKVVQKYVEDQGYNVVRELCGHGIGKDVHEDPEILNSVSFDRVRDDKVPYAGDGRIDIKEGMVLCVEPMVTVGDWRIKKSKDGFGFETKDGSLSCHFEHTIAVVKDGYKILTIL